MGILDLADPRRVLLSIDDLSEAEIASLMETAEGFLGRQEITATRRSFSVGLLFLAPSLRTHVGFAVATIRLGGIPVGLQTLRTGQEMSAGESLDDTLRVLSGMVDLIVLRTHDYSETFPARELVRCPLINGGNGSGDHPVQSLIDLFAIRRQAGPVERLHIGLCGDLRSRSARSLLRLFTRFPPAKIRLIAPFSRQWHTSELAPIRDRIEQTDDRNFRDLDVLYMVGLPQGEGDARLDAAARGRYSLTQREIETLPRSLTVLSPLPVIDEVDEFVRRDPRFGAFRQSDEGLYVRMAVLKLFLGL